MDCTGCNMALADDLFAKGEALMMESRSYCLACYDKIFHVTYADAPLVDMNESFDADAISLVEGMKLHELDDSDTGEAASHDTDTQTDTLPVDVSDV